MSVTTLSADSQAIALLCSSLALPRPASVKPLSPTEWSSLAATIHRSGLERPGALLGLDDEALERGLEISAEAARRLTALLARGGQLALELERLAGRGIWITTRADDAYPPLLKERLKHTAPPLLFGAGPQALLLERAIAVVGSREADESSLAFATVVGRRCATDGFAVVSGAARGVDTAAMVGAIDGGGGAIGIVADALERMASRKDLRDHLLEGSLALVSPFHPSARFTVGNAMGRNRLIYCLADASVVVSSGENGGTRGGALENLKADWTPLFVRTDDDAPSANRDLLAHGGLPLRRADLDDAEAVALLLARAPAERERQVSLDDLPAEPARTATGASATPTHDKQLEAGQTSDGIDDASDGIDDAGDLFPTVWPSIARFLKQPRGEKDAAAAFALELSQARVWLRRAVAEGLADRLERPVRYRVTTAQPKLFASEDEQGADSSG